MPGRIGFPAITDPRKPAEPDVQQAIRNIRERFQVLEAAVIALQSAGFDTSALQRQINRLSSDLEAQRSRITALEAITPTDVYVDGNFIGTRHALNFLRGTNIIITGTDDSVNDRVDLRFDGGGNITVAVERTQLQLRGHDVEVVIGKIVDVLRAQLFIVGHDVGLVVTQDILVDVQRASLRITGREVGVTAGANIQVSADRAHLDVRGRDVSIVIESDILVTVTRTMLRISGRDVIIDANVSSCITRDYTQVPDLDDQTLFSDSATGAQALSGSPTRFALTAGNTAGFAAVSRLNYIPWFKNGTVKVVMTTPATGYCGVVLRTTAWSNQYTSYAWLVYYIASTNNIGVGRGSDDPTSSSFVNVANGGSGKSPGDTWELKVVMNGQSFDIYVDGVFKFNVTNSNFEQIGGVGLFTEKSSGAITTLFHSVEVCDIEDPVFERNFADTSTADMTAYQGTIDASGGVLQATPTSGSVHERVYFDLLPTGSPTFISGILDMLLTVNLSGNTSSLTGLLMSVGDVSSDGTLQNGFWFDLVQQLSTARFVKLVSGGSSVPASTSLAGGAFTAALRVQRSRLGYWTAYLNDVLLYGPTLETTYTQWRPGMIFFANPGPASPAANFAIRYTP